MGGKKKYINIFGSFTEPFNCAVDLNIQPIASVAYSSDIRLNFGI